MDIGIPVEQKSDEHRVGLTPQGVYLLTQAGNRVYVEQGAGQGAGFRDEQYERSGARIVYSAEEIYGRADLVLKVWSPELEELEMARDEQTICAFWHLAARPREITQLLTKKGLTAIAYEMICDEDGFMPVLQPLSQIAGLMAPQIAARWLQNDSGGSGLLISGVPGIPPVDVVILGAGVVGTNATQAFLGLGARVHVLDNELPQLQYIEERFGSRVTTLVAYDFNIERVLKFADVVVGGVLIPGERAPVVVTREMVKQMRPRSVILDIAIDQGGCVETSRLTNHNDPVFVEEGVMHYCVPNMPGVVGRTATNAYLNAAWPYIQQLAELGTDEALDADPDLERGVAVHGGEVFSESLAALLEEV